MRLRNEIEHETIRVKNNKLFIVYHFNEWPTPRPIYVFNFFSVDPSFIPISFIVFFRWFAKNSFYLIQVHPYSDVAYETIFNRQRVKGNEENYSKANSCKPTWSSFPNHGHQSYFSE